jgi:hypothetical protein
MTMAPNKFRPHVQVLPEDAAHHDLAIGFEKTFNFKAPRQFQVLPAAGGWIKAKQYITDYHEELIKYTNRHIVILIDLDKNYDRLDDLVKDVPQDLANRVFFMGVLDEAEALKKFRLGTFEEIGENLAHECQNGEWSLWDHPQLSCNPKQTLKDLQDILTNL